MAYLNQIKQSPLRRGAQHRINAERFFNIDKLGWFYYRRGTSEEFQGIELHVGVSGPFISINQARHQLEREIELRR